MDQKTRNPSWKITARGLAPGAMVSLSDRGFRFGQHLFETIAVRGGRWLFYRQHVELLQSSAAEAGFCCEQGAVESLISLPAAKELHEFKEGVARLFWTAGEGSPTSPPSPGGIFLFLEHCDLPKEPQTLILHTEPFSCAPLGSTRGAWKTGNYWQNLAARQKALAEGCDEILLLTAAGKICSAAMGNLFYKRERGWFTPPLTDGARPGTTRAWLLGRGFAAQRSLGADEISSVSAWAVTNSRMGPACAVAKGGANSPDPQITALWQQWMKM